MEVDRTLTQATSRNHHPSCHHMEPRREEVGHETPGKEIQRGKHQESDGDDGHGQKTVAFFGRWPMLSKQTGI